MTLSQLAMEDMEALYLGSSFLMADPMGPLLDQDEEEALSPSSSLEVKAPASPSLSPFYAFSSPYQTMSFSPLSSSSPPSSPLNDSSSFLETKAETDLLSLSLLGTSNLLGTHVGADGDKDAFEDLDWMSEKIDLNEFDLYSLIGSCSSDESPSSPEDLLASPMDVDLDLGIQHSSPDQILLPDIPSLSMETSAVPENKATEMADIQDDVKSEPPSPPPSSPVYTLELGSEVDVLDVEKLTTPITTAIIPNPSEGIKNASPIVLSLSTVGRFVVVLSNKEETPLISVSNQSISSSPSRDCDSDSGIESGAGSPERHLTPPSSPTPGSSRTKPYCKPTASPSPKASKVKSASGTPKVVEKKLKKMEQNKTAATRYRQKKRVEHDQLTSEQEELEKKNQELKEKAESISREIQYLKDLMEEVRKHHRGKTLSAA